MAGEKLKVLSGRARADLWILQSAARQAAAERSVAVRVLLASRGAATRSAQREFWLEFAWIDQEYHAAVRALAQFCTRHSSSPIRRIFDSRG